jgi:hexosaminidase
MSSFAIVPKPVRLTPGEGAFGFSPATVIVAPRGAAAAGHLLADRLAAAAGFRLKVQGSSVATSGVVELRLDRALTGLGAEGYRLSVTPERVALAAAHTTGLFYAVQTLLQLLPPAIFRSAVAESVNWNIAPERSVNWNIPGGRSVNWNTPGPDSVNWNTPAERSVNWNTPGTDSVNWNTPAERSVNWNTVGPESVNWNIRSVEIEDYPRFGWRGAMLDVARHFMPKEFVLKFIDLIALHKLNVLHLHLTDDQGWRLEIKRYPRLTEVGAWRKETLVGKYQRDAAAETYDGKPHGGFYTQADVREIVAYANARGVHIVPEIEMPGHGQAAIAAYPELGNTGQQLPVRTRWGICENVFNVEESTIQFLQNVLAEVLDLFPSPFIHIGGDEAPKTQWKASPAAQTRMRELGLQNEDELQSYFVRRMDAFLNSRGRRLVGWDEILEGGLAPNATVMSWRGEDGGIVAAKAGHDVVMAPNRHTYLDYYQSEDRTTEPLAIGGYIPLAKVYDYEPIPAALSAEEAQHVLGAQGQLWTEYMPTPKQVEYMAFPRLCALAEVLWTPAAAKEYAGFMARLPTHLQRLRILDVNFRQPETGQ